MEKNRLLNVDCVVKQLSLKKIWDEIYSRDLSTLPWVNNPYPEEVFKNFVQYLYGADEILDYGCGTGRYYNILSKTGANLTFLDVSEKALAILKASVPKAITLCSDKPVNFPEKKYDGILLWGVLHHIDPKLRESFWNELDQCFNNGGIILIGGWSKNDIEFRNVTRISDITGTETWEIDCRIKEYLVGMLNYKLITSGSFSFTESYTNKVRLFSFYIMKK